MPSMASLVHSAPSVFFLVMFVGAAVHLISRRNQIIKWLRGVSFLFRGIKIIDQAYKKVSV
jgi:hypothetical protein